MTISLSAAVVEAPSKLSKFKPEMTDVNLYTKKKYDLMVRYAQRHYKLNHADLKNPKLIVIHYTASPTLKSTLYTFKSDQIANYRTKLEPYGLVNVGSHFIVNKDGKIYQTLPTTVMARHAIGFNHTSLAIENVGMGEASLTNRQIISNAKLVHYLKKKYPSIKYLIGHIEYMNRSYPHFKHFLHKDPTYDTTIKIDPGWDFMRRLREVLKRDYNLVLAK